MPHTEYIFVYLYFSYFFDIKFLLSICFILRLTLGLFFVTMFISMWISNTAATAMMIPIIETVLIELEAVSFRLFRNLARL